MSLVKVGPKHQVVIPKEVFHRLGVSPGDYVEITYTDKAAHIKPKKVVDLYTDEPVGPKTQAAINKALKEVKEGKVEGFYDKSSELIESLHKLSESEFTE